MSSDRKDFEISIICALPLEANAVKTIFEETEEITHGDGDDNVYTTGKIGAHKVALVHLPGMGKVPAAAAAANLKRSFSNIKLALVVGICGGVPGDVESDKGITLGDIVVGKQVVHYDFGRQYEQGFVRKDGPEDGLSRQNPQIRAFVKKLESEKESLKEKTYEYLTVMLKNSQQEIEALSDDLYDEEVWHIHTNLRECKGKKCRDKQEVCEGAVEASCEELGCDPEDLKRHMERKEKPDIHFGSIASGDKVMKSATLRDEIAKEEGVIAFDMEAAGVWDYLPCILIKGVCDYADSHKNKKWQGYASITAAAYTKAILELWNRGEIKKPKKPMIKNQWNNYNSHIAHQADKVINNGTQNFTF